MRYLTKSSMPWGRSDRWVDDVVGACPHFADQALVNRAARASRPCGIDPSRKSRSCPSPGQKRKPDLYAAATCTKVRSHLTLPRYRTAAKDISDCFERVRFASGLRPGDGNLSVAATTTTLSLNSY